MTDRIKGLTVYLDPQPRDDDCEALVNAIMMLRGVIRVTKSVNMPVDDLAFEKARREMRKKLLDAFED